MKENVLFILVDCLRADKCYGNNRTAKTPNIDSLIKNGIFFSKMITTTTTTTPSVASIFTGLYTFAHGVRSLRGYKLADNVNTLAEKFRENGYNTYAEVTGPLMPVTGLDRGFDSYSFRHQKEYFVDKWGDSFIKRFKNIEFKEPWFVFVHLWELHAPRRILEGYDNKKCGKNKYERALSSLDAKLGELFEYVNFNTTTIILSGDHGEKIIETMFMEHLYELKEFFKSAKEFFRKILAGVIRKTYKLFKQEYEKLPDFAKHNYKPKVKKPAPIRLFGHGFHIYDSAVVIPLIIAGNEKFPKNRFISTQVRQIDIFPTFVDAFNLDHDNKDITVHGQSLMLLIEGKNFDELPAYCEACGIVLGDKKYWKTGLRTPQYKYIYRPYNNDKYEELYDLEKDPLERKNIIKSQPEIASVLREQLLKIRKDDLKEIKLVGQKMTKEEEKNLTERLKNLGYLE